MLSRGGRPAFGFGLGAAATGSFAAAETELDQQVVAVVTDAGDVYYAADRDSFLLDFSDAVAAYQAAGQAGAQSVGPAIDAAGAAAVTQPLTQQAWQLNVQLSAIAKSGAIDPTNGVNAPYYTQANADAARQLVTQMVTLYTQAISQGAAAAGQPSPSSPAAPSSSLPQTPSGAASAPPAKSSGLWPILALATVAGAASLYVVKG